MILHWFNDGINNTQVKMDKYFLQKILNNKCRMEDFPGGPVARTLCSHAGAWVWSLVGELRSCRLHDVGKYINEEWTKEIKNYCRIPQWLSAVRKICLRIFKFSGWNFKEKQDICVASKYLLQKYLLTALVVRTHVHKYLDTCSSTNWTELKSLSHVQLFETLRTIAYQAPQSIEFSRQEYWSGLPFSSSFSRKWSLITLPPHVNWTWWLTFNEECVEGKYCNFTAENIRWHHLEQVIKVNSTSDKSC